MSDEKQEIIIFPNRSKTLVLACGALIFVIVGVLFAIGRGEIISQLRGWGLSLNLANSVSFCVIIIVSYAGVAFFVIWGW